VFERGHLARRPAPDLAADLRQPLHLSLVLASFLADALLDLPGDGGRERALPAAVQVEP
jgi:hypothetical protein